MRNRRISGIRKADNVNGSAKNREPPGDEFKATEALAAMKRMSTDAGRNGIANMTLDEINSEIAAAREEQQTLSNQTSLVLNDGSRVFSEFLL